MNLSDPNDVVLGTTCFNEHRRYNIPCQKSDCRQWINCKQANNCVLIESSKGPKTLQLVGTGYKAVVQGENLKISAGYSHDIDYKIPESINIKCPNPNTIEISGFNKQQVGQVTADIRSFRKPEPYKGKGIKQDTEIVHRKEGKKK